MVERVRSLQPFAIIRGNHDKVGSGVETPEGFNAVARNAIQWTYDAMSPENRAWLAALPAGPVQVDDLLEVCHGTPFDEDAYVFDDLDALYGSALVAAMEAGTCVLTSVVPHVIPADTFRRLAVDLANNGVNVVADLCRSPEKTAVAPAKPVAF